jgi:trigger factor
LPDLDDDFAQDISEFETLEELRNSLEERYQTEAGDRTKTNKQEALLAELIKHIDVDLPETMVRQEVDYSITQTAMQLQQQGMDIKKMFTQEVVKMLREQARPEAINRLRRTMALGEVAKQQSLKVEAEEITAKAQELIAQYEDQDLDMQRVRQVVEEDLLKDKIMDWLEQNNTVELVPEGTLVKEEEADAIAAADQIVEAVAEAVVETETVEAETVEAEAVEAEVAEATEATEEAEESAIADSEPEKPKKTSKIPAAKTGESAKKAKSSSKPTKSPSKSDPK